MRNGFTIIELLIVIAIFLVLIVAAFPIYGNLQVQAPLNESSSQIIQTLRLARERSVAGLNDKEHGVYFELDVLGTQDRYVLYQGSSFDLRDLEYDREILLDESLNLSLPEGVIEYEVNFSKGLGLPSNFGTIILTHDVKGSRSIVINSWGMVEGE